MVLVAIRSAEKLWLGGASWCWPGSPAAATDEDCMASENILDFDRLLSSISADNPCGQDLRWEPIYQEIKDARPKDDRDAFGLDSPVIANWMPVIELTSDALASQSKDLMLAAWLTEALVHQYGFAGFRDGIKLINGLLED